MGDIKYLVARVWPLDNTPASDGSIITRQVWEEYLNSPQYKESIEAGSAIGSMTHIARDNKHLANLIGDVSKLIGKDDQMLLSGVPEAASPVWAVKEFYIEDNWVKARMLVFDEEGADPNMANSIKRLKTLVNNGALLGVSAVIVAFWDNKGGADFCQKIHSVKSIDVTLCPSQKKARIIDVLDSDGDSILDEVRTFSEKEETTLKAGTPVAKCFSDLSSMPEISNLPKTSKIGLKFTTLKVKEFSCLADLKQANTENNSAIQEEKTFSVAAVKERLRYGKMSPRMQFRRLMIDYKGALKLGGNNLSEEDIRIMKSLFANDVLLIIKQIHPEVMKGKLVATLIGASSISKNARVASQRLLMPYRLAMQSVQKTGTLSRDRYQKILEAYAEFTDSLIDEVFNGKTLPTTPAEDNEEGND